MKNDIQKMTKKQRKEYFKKFRNLWKINPITRRKENGYKRDNSKVNIEEED